MQVLSLPPIMMASVCLYNAAYFFSLYYRRRNEKESLTYGFTCLSVAVYDICCAGLYNSESLIEGINWQRGQFAAICFLATSIIWFTKDFTKSQTNIVEKTAAIYYGVMFLVVIAISSPLTLTAATPSIKDVSLSDSIKITYFESNPGILLTLMVIVCALLFAYLIYRLIQYNRLAPKQKTMPIIISFFFFYLAIINDILLGEGVYTFIYVAEYAFMGIVLVMGYALQNRFINLQNEVEVLNLNLEKKVRERTRQVKEAQQELIENAHKAGMADIAAGTVHNIGNILNSVKISTSIMEETLKKPILEKFKMANNLLKANSRSLKEFIVNNPKGEKLLLYYLEIEDSFNEENKLLTQNLERLSNKVDAIADVINVQQKYAVAASLTEKCDLAELIEHAIDIQNDSKYGRNLNIEKIIDTIQPVKVQKTKFLHIIINLIKNAKESMKGLSPDSFKLKIEVTQNGNKILVKVSDNGSGIKADELKKIFNHGYTTKPDGKGIGLHSCANYMTEMNGKIWAESEGEGRGAVFILEFILNE